MLLTFVGSVAVGFAQTGVVPGQIYFDSTGFVEYRAGNLPIILSAPHGGNWSPDSIPNRDCSGCVYTADSYTRVITWGIYDAIVATTGCYPHVVMNRLHRRKFDANRDVGDAADGNPLIEKAWRGYHAFVDEAKLKVQQDYGRGLFLDVHGHGHTTQRIELGYLLNTTDLGQTDATLNTSAYVDRSSIRTLVANNVAGLSHAQLLRGTNSFGSLLVGSGFPSVPSASDPDPACSGSCFFSGGYNTSRNGSQVLGAPIDAIQLELDQTARNSTNRPALIGAIANAALAYITAHYNPQFVPGYCSVVLPVQWVDFQASYQAQTQSVWLMWTTASEVDNAFFEVERSTDGQSWLTVGRQRSQGGSTTQQRYRWTDDAPLSGMTSYYRLQQVDLDGTATYSAVRSVRLPQGLEEDLLVFPNPVDRGEHLQLTSRTGIRSVRMYTPSGVEVTVVLEDGVLHLPRVASGLFVLRVELGNGKISYRRIWVQ